MCLIRAETLCPIVVARTIQMTDDQYEEVRQNIRDKPWPVSSTWAFLLSRLLARRLRENWKKKRNPISAHSKMEFRSVVYFRGSRAAYYS